MNRYPDMGSTALYDALADRLGVADRAPRRWRPARSALIYQLVQAFCEPGDEVVYAWRSFEAYPIAVTAAGATQRAGAGAAPTAATTSTRWPRRSPTAPRSCIVCTPNNPTGPAVTQAELDAFLARVPEHVLVVVDEAYVEFVRMDDPVDGVATVRAPRQRRARPAPSPRPTAWPASGSGTPSRPPPIAGALRAVSPAVRRLQRRPGRRHRLARAPSPSCSSGSSALVAERDRVVDGLARRRARTSPRRRATSSGSPPGDRTADFAAAADELGIVVRPVRRRRAPGSRIGEPEANDRVIELAARFAP